MRDIFEEIHELDEFLSGEDLADEESELPAAAPAEEPIGFVKRELEGPDGSIIEVEVPVYAASDGTAPDVETDADAEGGSGDPAADESGVQLEDLSELLAREDAD